jgi:uncharacterized protein
VSFEDLTEGMMITGKIKNVVDFGAFVDLGIKETALVHISELSDQYVKDPMDAVKVGDVLEFRIIGLDRDRRRISLSRKKEVSPAETHGGEGKEKDRVRAVPQTGEEGGVRQKVPADTGSGEGKRRVVVKKAGGGSARPPSSPRSFGSSPVPHAPPPSRPRSEPESSAGAPPPRKQVLRAEDDDGTMYNPFAEAFRKSREKKPGRS